MVETTQTVERRQRSAEQLLSVTRTMRGIAAANLRRFERSNQALDLYEAAVETGLQIALRDERAMQLIGQSVEEPGPQLLLALGSNQGLCGSVNVHVADRVAQEMASNESRLVVVGHRLSAELDRRRAVAGTEWDTPSRIESVTPLVERILDEGSEWRAEHPTARFIAVLPHFRDRRRGYEIVTLRIAPTDRDLLSWLAMRRWPERTLPTFQVPWEVLVPHLLEQALRVRLHRAISQTMASVAWSRLMAMDAAERNVEDHLDVLRREGHQLRQDAVTAELLDVVSGAEVLRSPDS